MGSKGSVHDPLAVRLELLENSDWPPSSLQRDKGMGAMGCVLALRTEEEYLFYTKS